MVKFSTLHHVLMMFNPYEPRDAHVMMTAIAFSGELRQYLMPKTTFTCSGERTTVSLLLMMFVTNLEIPGGSKANKRCAAQPLNMTSGDRLSAFMALTVMTSLSRASTASVGKGRNTGLNLFPKL